MAATIVDPKAVEVATLAQRVVPQYFSHHTAMHIARDPRSSAFAPPVELGQIVPVLKIPRRDGNAMIMSFDHYLVEGRKPDTRQEFDKVWLIGALLTVNDTLGQEEVLSRDRPEARWRIFRAGRCSPSTCCVLTNAGRAWRAHRDGSAIVPGSSRHRSLAGAKRRLADEYDGAQERGEIASRGGERSGREHSPLAPTAEEIGIDRKDIHEARIIRDAEAADHGVVRRTLDEKLKQGEEPTKAY
jgi:hypothetical protein